MSKDDEFKVALSCPTRDAEYFAKDADVPLNPLAGWTLATLPENYVMLGIEYLSEKPTITAHILRLAMTRSRAAEMSKALGRLARTPHVEPPEKLN